MAFISLVLPNLNIYSEFLLPVFLLHITCNSTLSFQLLVLKARKICHQSMCVVDGCTFYWCITELPFLGKISIALRHFHLISWILCVSINNKILGILGIDQGSNRLLSELTVDSPGELKFNSNYTTIDHLKLIKYRQKRFDNYEQ